MTPTETFEHARDALLRNREDLERARAEFRWPELGEFNWAWDWLEVLADHGVERGDRILVMLTNVMPLWETMLAAIKVERGEHEFWLDEMK